LFDLGGTLVTLDHPLLGLIKNCETICEAACCGRDAFDFSPLHIGSFLIRYTGKIETAELTKIEGQLAELAAESHRLLKESGTATIEAMNQILTGQELAELSAEISKGLAQAVELVSIAERLADDL
jgi:hypothetical protein